MRSNCHLLEHHSEDLREWLEEHEIHAVIPRRSHETAEDNDVDDLYRERNLVERAFNRLKRFRAVVMRYDKLASSYVATVTIACILEWMRPLPTRPSTTVVD